MDEGNDCDMEVRRSLSPVRKTIAKSAAVKIQKDGRGGYGLRQCGKGGQVLVRGLTLLEAQNYRQNSDQAK